MEAKGPLKRHLSKSASDLSTHIVHDAGPGPPTPSPSHSHGAPKTHSFLSALKLRWSRGRSKDRKKQKKKSEDERCDSRSTDYAADNSSEHSSSATQSPQHRHIAHPTSNMTDVGGASSSIVTCDGADMRAHCSSKPPSPPSLPLLMVDEEMRRREAALRQHSFFQLRVHLKRGIELVARDKGGTSDPYVKLKVGGRLLYKSKTIYRELNPVWDEVFTVPIEDPFVPVHLKVFDYDWGLQDDFMGSVYIDLTKLELSKLCEMRLELRDPNKSEYLGEILLTVTLYPRSQEDKDQYFQRSSRIGDVNKRLKSQIWSSVVTIVLVEGKNLQPMDMDGFSDPYIKFRLGNEKYKSKIISKSLNPRWLEQFDLHLYDDQGQELELTVWDKDRSKDDFMGRCSIDLSTLEREKTHGIWCNLEEGAGSIFLLLTISGTTASETISDLTTHEENPRERTTIVNRYAFRNTLHNLRDVGHLTVKVYRATGLAAADLGGKSDPFCVLELVNARLQTQTEYKTLSPSWQKIFTFNIKDINSVLEITVYDEDRDHKVEFLGKIAIPLLRIRNGEKKWYCLKDKKLRSRAKGTCPMILMEMHAEWNPLRAWIRTINPKEEKLMQAEVKFKRQVFVRNVLRLKEIIMTVIGWGKLIQDWFEWERPAQSAVALVLFVTLCHYFEPYMILALLLAIFLKYYAVLSLTGGWANSEEEDEILDDDDDDDDKDKEEKKSLKERLQAIQEVTQTVQNAIGYIASLGEQIKNTFNFTIPFLSWLAMLMVFLGMVVLYFVPMRYLIMLFGVNKFARKLIRPHTIPNNEVLDLLSRIPDDENLIEYRELRPYSSGDNERRRDRRRHKTGT